MTLIGGAFSLTAAMVFSQAVNYATHIGLGRVFTPAVYGHFGILASVFALLEVLLRWGLPRTVSFHIARDKEVAKAVLKKAFALQAFMSLLFFLVFFVWADSLAALLGAPGFAAYLRVSALFILTFASEPVYSGLLNGLGAFSKQGLCAAAKSLTRLLLIIIFIAAGMGIYGVIAAYILSPLAAIGYAAWATRSTLSASEKSVEVKALVSFGFPLFVSSIATSLLMRIDLFMVQALLQNQVLTGFYNAAFTLIRGPYFLSMGTGLVSFRFVAQLKASSSQEARKFISQCIRYYLLVLTPLPFMLSASAEGIFRITFGENYLPAAPIFRILSFCLVFMILYQLLANFIAALGRPRWGMGLGLFLLPIQAFFIYEWVFAMELAGAALATTVTWAAGCAIAIFYLWRWGYLTLPNRTTLIRLVIASSAVFATTFAFSPTNLWLLLLYPLVYLAYVAILRLTGEISGEEIQNLLVILHATRRKAKGA